MKRGRTIVKRTALCVILLSLALFSGCSGAAPAGQSINSRAQGTNGQGSNSQHKLTIEDIEKNCAAANEEILNTRKYDNYYIVESRPQNSHNIITLYNLKTGDKDMLPNNEYRIDFEKTHWVDENHIILYSDGSNYVSGYQRFPLEIHCERYSEVTGSYYDFAPNLKDVKFPVDEKLSVRGKAPHVKEEVTDIRATVNGIQVCFGPQDSNDVNYDAAYIDCPAVDISYDKVNREFTLNFQDSRLAKSYTGISSLPYNNSYIESISLAEGENTAAIKIKLKEDAKYYIGEKDTIYFLNSNTTDFPYMDIQFLDNNENF